MSGGPSCKCPEKKKPITQRAWLVIDRLCNYSAFNGRHYTPSDYSHVVCVECDASWRTKATYVVSLTDGEYRDGGWKAK
jgi:hypothetical protein